MREIKFTADELISALLNLPKEQGVAVLDSCGVSHLGSRFLIAGLNATETLELNETDVEKTLKILDEYLTRENEAAIFTIGYDFGLKLNRITPRLKQFPDLIEPDVFLSLFDCLIVHDYRLSKTFITGNEKKYNEIEEILSALSNEFDCRQTESSIIVSNFTRESYISAVRQIQEHIRDGDTYQANLTQQIRAQLPFGLTAEQIFFNLRKTHPAPFAAFIRRRNDTVISVSPERFLKIQDRDISVSPIKGTRPRGRNVEDDLCLKRELLESAKDRAENVMIVDLLRNDIGRICEFGSIRAEKLCDLETHPTLFHLVSTISGKIRENVRFSDILRAVFPSGSITGAPKISTMRIIEQIESASRGLSMGTIGCSIQTSKFKARDTFPQSHSYLDLSVAIRTMVIRDNEGVFNVGGGIVIDSVPELEYEETLVKAKALLTAINANTENLS